MAKRPTPLYLYIGGENPETGGFEGKNELYCQGAALPPGRGPWGSGGGLEGVYRGSRRGLEEELSVVSPLPLGKGSRRALEELQEG